MPTCEPIPSAALPTHVSTPDYLAASVPPEKDPQAYTYVERRADLLDRIIAAGSPRAIHQGRLAEVYDVSESQVSQDMDRLAEDIYTHLTDSLELSTLALYEHTIDHLHDQGKYKQAWDVHMEWLDFLDERVSLGSDATAEARHQPPDAHSEGDVTLGRTLTPQAEAHIEAIIEREHPGNAAKDSTARTTE